MRQRALKRYNLLSEASRAGDWRREQKEFAEREQQRLSQRDNPPDLEDHRHYYPVRANDNRSSYEDEEVKDLLARARRIKTKKKPWIEEEDSINGNNNNNEYQRTYDWDTDSFSDPTQQRRSLMRDQEDTRRRDENFGRQERFGFAGRGGGGGGRDDPSTLSSKTRSMLEKLRESTAALQDITAGEKVSIGCANCTCVVRSPISISESGKRTGLWRRFEV